MNQPQTVEQPQGDSAGEGISSMDDAVAAVAAMEYDNEEQLAPVEDSEEQPEEVEESEDEEPESDDDQPEDSEESEESDDDQPEASEDVADLPDDDLVIAQDGEIKVTLGELREKYQEAASAKDEMQAEFTRKTQSLAEKAKSVEASEEKALAHYQQVVNALGQGLREIDQTTDWQSLKATDPGEFQTRLAQRNQLESQLQQFGQGAESLLQEAQARKTELAKAESREALTYLKENINGWNQDGYEKVAGFVESQGMTKEQFYELRSGPVIRMLHDLMRSNEARETALQKISKKPQTEAKQKAQKRSKLTASQRKIKALEGRVEKFGDTDAAVELLMRQPYDN